MEGRLADISHALIFEALTRAAAAPDGVPLLASRSATGLFAGSAAGKIAARRSLDEGLLCVLRSDVKGKTRHEVCGITEKGFAFLLYHADPRPVLQSFVEALQGRAEVLEKIQKDVRRTQQDFDTLRTNAARVLQRLEHQAEGSHRNGHDSPLPRAICDELARWHEAGPLGDCPLPELFRKLRATAPLVTIGTFHDQLRHLHQAQQIYLHPWTGPLYELPEPALALLIGHEIAYYASLRQSSEEKEIP